MSKLRWHVEKHRYSIWSSRDDCYFNNETTSPPVLQVWNAVKKCWENVVTEYTITGTWNDS